MLKTWRSNFEWKGGGEGGRYYISQTCDQQQFKVKKVVFSWECLNIFATGCSMDLFQNLRFVLLSIFGVHISG